MAVWARYDDGRVLLDDSGVTLRRYYFPLFAAKRIPYAEIRGVTRRPVTWRFGKFRAWGTDHPRYWMPLDVLRWRRPTVVALDLGSAVRPAFTPDDPDRVLQILRERTGLPADCDASTG